MVTLEHLSPNCCHSHRSLCPVGKLPVRVTGRCFEGTRVLQVCPRASFFFRGL